MEQLEKRKRVVIKIGSNLTLDKAILKKIIDTIIEIKKNCDVIIVASGAVGFGRKEKQNAKNNQALAAIGQIALMQEFKERIEVAQILVSHDDLTNKLKKQNIKNTINALLELNTIPVFNENDPVSTEELNLGDNDQLASNIAISCDADEFYSLTDANGILNANNKNIEKIDISRFSTKLIKRFEEKCVKTDSKSGTGGILAKLVATIRATQKGVKSFIINGNNPKVLLDLAQENYDNIGNYTMITGNMNSMQNKEFEKYVEEGNHSKKFNIPYFK